MPDFRCCTGSGSTFLHGDQSKNSCCYQKIVLKNPCRLPGYPCIQIYCNIMNLGWCNACSGVSSFDSGKQAGSTHTKVILNIHHILFKELLHNSNPNFTGDSHLWVHHINHTFPTSSSASSSVYWLHSENYLHPRRSQQVLPVVRSPSVESPFGFPGGLQLCWLFSKLLHFSNRL